MFPASRHDAGIILGQNRAAGGKAQLQCQIQPSWLKWMPLQLPCFTFCKGAARTIQECLHSHLVMIAINLSVSIQHALLFLLHQSRTHCLFILWCLSQWASGVQRQIDSEFTLCVYLILTIIYLYWLLQGTQLLKIQIKSYHWCFKEYHGDITVTQSSNIQLHLLPIIRKAIRNEKTNYI